MCTICGSRLLLSGHTTSGKSTIAARREALLIINGSGTSRTVGNFQSSASSVLIQSRCSDSLSKCHQQEEPGKFARALFGSTGESMNKIQIITMGASDNKLVSIRGTI